MMIPVGVVHLKWLTTGPLIGTSLTRHGITAPVTHYCQPEGRRPALWKWNEEVLVEQEMTMTTTPAVIPTAVIQQRLEQVLDHIILQRILPICIRLAVLEDMWIQYLQSITVSKTLSKTTTTSIPDRPEYYNTSTVAIPLKQSPSLPCGTDVATILARIQQGFALVTQHYIPTLRQQQLLLHQYTDASIRRSSRLPIATTTTAKTSTHSSLSPWQKGGRIALWLLDQQQQQQQPMNWNDNKNGHPTTSTTATLKQKGSINKENGIKDHKSTDALDPSDSAHHDDKDEEVVAAASDNPHDEGDDDNDQHLDNEEDDTLSTPEDDAASTTNDEHYILDNPYLQPTPNSLLDFIATRGKKSIIHMHHIQAAIEPCLKDPWYWDDPLSINHHVLPPGPLKLKAVGEQSYRLVSVNQSDSTDDITAPPTTPPITMSKAWALWRFQGIHAGYTIWPSWTDTVHSWRPPPDLDIPIDATDISRRSGRRVASTTTGVYYGIPSALSHKQLMETIVRLCRSVAFHTLPSLEALVGTRLGTALSTLVYKRRQLHHTQVTTWESDKEVWNAPSLFELPEKAAETMTRYLHHLHQTELQLRHLILYHLTQRSIPAIATAADERWMDEEETDETWLKTGHEYIGKQIFRPGRNMEHCQWWTIEGYSPAIVSLDTEVEIPLPPSCPLVQRRARFRVVGTKTKLPIVLTEAQVHAGIQAGEMELVRSESSKHPLAGGVGTKVTLKGVEELMFCTIAGQASVVLGDERLQHQLLLMPDSEDLATAALWLTIQREPDGSLCCTTLTGMTTYTLLQSDYDHGSPAFEACRSIVDYLKRLSKAEIFMDPVDPVALGIPTYFSIVKRSMSISVLEANLDQGLYSKIQVGPTTGGKSAVARMLNGPFKEDALLIFDNATLFNPPDDWIHLTAVHIRKALVKKFDMVTHDADSGARRGHKQYVDLDSDVDMDESDKDEDRKRRRKVVKDEGAPLRDTLVPLRLQNLLSETQGLKGPFGNISVATDSSLFSLTPEWNCRHQVVAETEEDPVEKNRREELEGILEIQRLAEEEERTTVRRSVRSQLSDNHKGPKKVNKGLALEYYLDAEKLPPLPDDDDTTEISFAAPTRKKIEAKLELAHETYYAKLFKHCSKELVSGSGYGVYSNDSYPPYLGRVVPGIRSNDGLWEIRSTYIVPALRWVLRGLIHSGHLTDVEPLSMDAPFLSGVVVPNDIYYVDKSITPFGVLESRKKKRENTNGESSEEEIELSEYERMRADRMARNAERLKTLGLA